MAKIEQAIWSHSKHHQLHCKVWFTVWQQIIDKTQSYFEACCRGIRYNDGEPFWSGFKQIWALIITTEARTVLLCFVTKILESFIILIAKKPASISVDFYDCCINRLLSSHCLEWLSFGRVERQVCDVSDEIRLRLCMSLVLCLYLDQIRNWLLNTY